MTAVGGRHALLYDTETALRLVDGEVRAMTEERGGDAAPSFLIECVRTELRAVLCGLRDGRAALEGIEIQDTTAEQLATVASALVTVEHRLARVVDFVDSTAGSGSLALH